MILVQAVHSLDKTLKRQNAALILLAIALLLLTGANALLYYQILTRLP